MSELFTIYDFTIYNFSVVFETSVANFSSCEMRNTGDERRDNTVSMAVVKAISNDFGRDAASGSGFIRAFPIST